MLYSLQQDEKLENPAAMVALDTEGIWWLVPDHTYSRPYFWNTKTGAVCWSCPPGLQLPNNHHNDASAKDSAAAQPALPAQPSNAAPLEKEVPMKEEVVQKQEPPKEIEAQEKRSSSADKQKLLVRNDTPPSLRVELVPGEITKGVHRTETPPSEKGKRKTCVTLPLGHAMSRMSTRDLAHSQLCRRKATEDPHRAHRVGAELHQRVENMPRELLCYTGQRVWLARRKRWMEEAL
jgi:hypothetical protein